MQKEGQTFFAYIKELGENGTKELWLAVESKLPLEEAIKFIPTQLKIAPKSKLSSIVINATNGISCVHSITSKQFKRCQIYFTLS